MKRLLVFHLVVVLPIIIENVASYKILGLFHMPSRSHHILGSALLKALADKGHEVTMISPFPFKHLYPNYTDLELTGVTDISEDHNIRSVFTNSTHISLHSQVSVMFEYNQRVIESVLNHSTVRKLISSKQKFDVVIPFYFLNDAHLALAHYLDAHNIIFSTIGSNEALNELTRNPAPTSYVPSIFFKLSGKMNFWQRVQNTLFGIALYIYIQLINKQKQQTLLDKYLPGAPPLNELRKNISLVLINSHFTIEGPRPHLPNMIQIGGFHIQPPKDLTGKLKEFMDSATSGVILFSLGSNVRSSELPLTKLQAILSTFAALPQKVLWKFEDENVANIPTNVKISKWLPQTDILAHPNLKVFITHGGLLSITEAIYHGVPIVGIPMFGDQRTNINEAVFQGYAILVGPEEITFDKLSWAIREVLNNPRYRIKAKELSAVFKDRPKNSLSEAIYWIEYVIKHKGAPHLRSAALELEWYQLYSLDVFAFYLSALLLLVLVLYYLIYKLPLLLITKIFKRLKPSQVKVKKN